MGRPQEGEAAPRPYKDGGRVPCAATPQLESRGHKQDEAVKGKNKMFKNFDAHMQATSMVDDHVVGCFQYRTR